MSEQPAAVEYRTTFEAKPKPKRQYQTTLPRAMLGTFGAAACPGLLLSVGAFAATHGGGREAWWFWPLATAIYTLGFSLIGALAAPVWWLLDRRGVREPWAAALVGAIPCGVTAIGAMIAGSVMGHAPPLGALGALSVVVLIAAGAGAVMGVIAWRIAYRKVPDAAEVF